jgi:hypothetical protein
MHSAHALILGLLVASPAIAHADETPPQHESAPTLAPTPPKYDGSGYVAPKFVPYEGGDIPSYAHIETRPNIAFIATGTSIFGSAYVTSLIYGLATCGAQTNCRSGSGWLYLPIAGPFVTSAQAPTTGGQALAAFDGGVQVLGVALTIVGFAMPRKYVTWQTKTATLTLSPTVGGAANSATDTGSTMPATKSGLSLVGKF